MTLKEKFEEILIAFWTSEWEKECEQVADEFAIGFAEWAIAKNMGVNKFTLYEGELEIYKKEKGL